ncbi:MAG: hypothetical protein ACLQNE_26260 [Thermoguttaceae bacterium]|jgi:predicted ATPase
MFPHELLAIENPEVHLHPRLQVAMAEFLLHQASSGKWFLVETHSDLIVGRIIQALLEERFEMGQEKFRIYFSSLKANGAGCECSSLMPVSVEEDTGRIDNWPRGFMDDQLRQSSRLFDIIYGILPEDPDASEGNGT